MRIWYNDKHPSAWAGQPLMHEESRNYRYSAALGGGDNPWASFNLKKDWEVVRWAKLRGVGSMVFSDLLAINGICFYVLCYDAHTCLFNRSMKPSISHTRTQMNSIELLILSYLDGHNSSIERLYRVGKS